MFFRTLVASLILLHSFTTWANPLAKAKFSLFPAGSFTAETSDVKGEAHFQGNKATAHNVVINLKSLKTGISLRDRHMRERLEVEKYPTAVLVSGTGENGNGKGKIKIRNVTKDVQGTYKDLGNGFAEAKFPLKITDFDLEQPGYMGVEVEDEFEVTVILPIKKK